MTSPGARIGAVLRAAYPRALARVLGMVGDLQVAEDALHDAIERALSTWPSRGIPQAPEAWLVTVARNRNTDRIRKRASHERHAPALTRLEEHGSWSPTLVEPEALLGQGWGDDLLRMIFTCCDPVLGTDERIALTLATVAGLSTVELSRAFLVEPRTMEQRLTRAKRRLRQRRGTYAPIGPEVAPERLGAVLTVIHLVFNEGYWGGRDDAPIRRDLCRLAVGLARSLQGLLPERPEVDGLLALLLIHQARMPARLDAQGHPVPLPEQDRSLWDRERAAEGSMLLQAALARGRPGPFQLEAAIAAVHTAAATAERTDWSQIAELYGLLAEHRPTAVVRIHWAFAVGRAHGAERGLAQLREEDLEVLDRYPYAHLVVGTLLEEAGRVDEAIFALRRAVELARNAAEAAQIRRRLERLERRGRA